MFTSYELFKRVHVCLPFLLELGRKYSDYVINFDVWIDKIFPVKNENLALRPAWCNSIGSQRFESKCNWWLRYASHETPLFMHAMFPLLALLWIHSVWEAMALKYNFFFQLSFGIYIKRFICEEVYFSCNITMYKSLWSQFFSPLEEICVACFVCHLRKEYSASDTY